MPELPEVETTRRQIAPAIVGRTIASIAIHAGAERLAMTHSPRELEEALTGRRIEALERHGKYLLARLDDGRTWVLHLRMTGSLVVAPSADAHPHERARVVFDDGTTLRFNDMRKFGTWHLVDEPGDAMPHVGPDALSEEFSPTWLLDQLRRRSIAVKSALLDQKVAAGVGNIYADEACYIAGIDPRTSSNRLGAKRVARLHGAVIEALERSIEDGGTTLSDYVNGLGGEGQHKTRVHVFRREDEPCDECGTTIRKVRLGGRGTHFCPRCQRR